MLMQVRELCSPSDRVRRSEDTLERYLACQAVPRGTVPGRGLGELYNKICKMRNTFSRYYRLSHDQSNFEIPAIRASSMHAGKNGRMEMKRE